MKYGRASSYVKVEDEFWYRVLKDENNSSLGYELEGPISNDWYISEIQLWIYPLKRTKIDQYSVSEFIINT